MKRILIPALALALCAGAGCIIARGHGPYGEHTVIWAPGLGTRILVDHDHVCSARCGHYWHDARWYDGGGHRHGVGCGHHWIGGR